MVPLGGNVCKQCTLTLHKPGQDTHSVGNVQMWQGTHSVGNVQMWQDTHNVDNVQMCMCIHSAYFVWVPIILIL